MILLETVADIDYGVVEAGDVAAMVQVIAHAFFRHEPMARALDLSQAQLNQTVTAFGPKALTEGLSIVARVGAAGETAGALLVVDFATPPPDSLGPLIPVLAPILAMLDELDVRYRQVTPSRLGECLHLVMIGVPDEWSGRGIAQEMVRMCLANGMAKGYRRAVTEATGSLSQRVFDKIGFERRFFASYREFELDGQHPFASILDHEGCALMERHIAAVP
jgi:ribosomal protein S18 acetylase RimI-like enzyme